MLALLLACALAAGCSGSSGDGATTTGATTSEEETASQRLTLLASSSLREPFERLATMFRATPAGADVLVERSFGNSEAQARAVAYGLPADVVSLTIEADLLPLEEAELIGRGWRDDEHGGSVARSLVVFAVRSGNPGGIRGWDDLVQPRVRVVASNPATSGVGRWAIVAAYGAQLELGRTPAQARQYLLQLFRNLSFEGASSREAVSAFTRGEGHVLITSEAEARAAQRKGSPIDYVIPDQTIQMESPIVVTLSAPPAAREFVDFLRTEAAQRVFAQEGHRPVVESAVAGFDFPAAQSVFTIEKLGGWRDAQLEFFDPSIGIVATVQRDLGSTG